jgi:hypothetical protein
MDPETRRRFGVSLRNAAVVSSIFALDEYLDTNLISWTLHVPALAKALIEEPIKELWKSITDDDHEFHFDPSEDLYNGITAAPAVDSVLKGSSKYGLSSAFWSDQLAPNVVKRFFMEPADEELLGEGVVERNLRNISGQYVLSAQEEKRNAFERRQKKRQMRSANRQEQRWTGNPVK